MSKNECELKSVATKNEKKKYKERKYIAKNFYNFFLLVVIGHLRVRKLQTRFFLSKLFVPGGTQPKC